MQVVGEEAWNKLELKKEKRENPQFEFMSKYVYLSNELALDPVRSTGSGGE